MNTKPGNGPAPDCPAEPAEPQVLYEGQHVRLVRRHGWEFAERRSATGIVAIVAVTGAGRLVLTEQFREPLERSVIELPAGLAGDEPGAEAEALTATAHRELLEETGYEAQEMIHLTEGPPSAGLSNEIITFFRATGLRKIAAGGGVGHEKITVHEVPLTEVSSWLRAAACRGLLVDPKVYTALYFLGPGASP